MTTFEKIKEEFISRYPKNYANEPELGGRSCVFSLNEVLQIIDKYAEQEPTIRPSFSYTAEIKADDEQLERLQGILNGEMVLRLEQEPSEDAVSRQAVLDGLKGCICEEWIKTLFATMVKQLPSARPQEPKESEDKE